jgi:catechol 2,3-dioxygenase-like lactoylglutathione lyase family enzyme
MVHLAAPPRNTAVMTSKLEGRPQHKVLDVSIIKVEGIAFVRFRVPDLSEMRVFLEEFGLSCLEQDGKLFGRGTDGSPFVHVAELGEPGFAGLGFRARSRADLDVLAERNAVTVDASDAPGGGFCVRLRDPDGNTIDVVAEQTWASAEMLAPDIPINSASERRRFREPIRFGPGPSQVYRLGHAVLNVANFAVSEAWYKNRFGLITSDQIEVEPGAPFGAFLRCDRGDTPTDHHTLFLLQAPSGPGFNHAAFEVGGLDDLMKGHSYLKSRNRQHSWGVGRHVLGSQIFDYWKDPWGHELEHWTDGDLFIASDPPGVAGLTELLGALWGPQHPAASGGK